MTGVRRVWAVLAPAWGCGLIAGIALDWVLGVDGPWLGVGVVAGTLAGGVLGVREARRIKPMAADERRDAILGWGAVVGAVAAVACLLLPLPWGALAAAAVVAATVLALRRV
jgi:hypothetical protein